MIFRKRSIPKEEGFLAKNLLGAGPGEIPQYTGPVWHERLEIRDFHEL